MIGARYLPTRRRRRRRARNIVCTDIGGTSFDIALITDGEFSDQARSPTSAASCSTCRWSRSTRSAPAPARSCASTRTRAGPSSGPTRPAPQIGVSWAEGGLETPSVTDLNLVLGRVNPDYFLGGDVQLDTERARAAVEEQIAEPLGLDVEQAAAGIIELFDETLKYEAVAQVLGKGYSPVDYTLLCYGGGGPLHVAGYTRRRPVPRRAGARVGGRVLRLRLRLRRLRLPLRPDDRPADRARRRRRREARASAMLHRRRLADAARAVVEEFAKSRRRPQSRSSFRHYVRMQYYGQLNDLEIYSPHQELDEAAHVDALIAAFEDAYGKLYARSARSPELGYLVTNVIVTGSVRGREAGAAGRARRSAARREPKGSRAGVVARRLDRHAASTSRTTSRAGQTRRRARRSSSRPPTRSRSRPGRTRAARSHTASSTSRAPKDLEAPMAIVDRTRELEPARGAQPIGWDGRTALEMLERVRAAVRRDRPLPGHRRRSR